MVRLRRTSPDQPGWTRRRAGRGFVYLDAGGERLPEEDAQRVRDLNAKVRDIRKEQQFQREREAEFRDLSEKTNTRAIYWSAIQMVVLFGTCVWQLRHLRVFFEDKKLR